MTTERSRTVRELERARREIFATDIAPDRPQPDAP
jgi:hypothetical protein